MNEAGAEMMSIFGEALDRASPSERAAYLDAACTGNPDLRDRIDALLKAHDQAGGFLAEPTASGPAAAMSAPAVERPGDMVGAYRLMEQIGEGGMGLVFVAEQQHPVRRKLALKVIKPGMDTRQVVARFEAERQALALMDHPNIARVIDGGATATGRPYFVMELVKGQPITTYCDENKIPTRERLALSLDVCQAVQHAHQKGIIHRDLKPGNVLVASHDGTPVIKIIDFGVAKAIDQQLTDKTVYTQLTQLVGTPQYMSPEQAGQSSLDIDTRSDIYSLGVLLYELLTGSTPLTKERFQQAAFDEIRRIIREEDPPKPSTRLAESGDTLPAISELRHTEPAKLTRLVRGELDWIVMKALEKDRHRRYETASSFARDIRHYLDNEPVEACPPSAAYRVRKFVGRNKGAVAATAVTGLMVLLGVVGLAISNVLITREKSDKEIALRDREAALIAASASEQDAREQLFQALLQRARVERGSGRVGQRFETLRVIRQAAAIRVTPELAAEAAAALVLPDAEIARQWDAFPEGSIAIGFDSSFERYARLDKQGSVTVCRSTGDREEIVARLPAHGQSLFIGIRMSPNGGYAAYGHGGAEGRLDGKLRVWKLDGPAPAVALDEVDVHFRTVAFHPDSQQLAFAQSNGMVTVYDLTAGQPIQGFELGSAPAHLAFNPRDHRMAIARGNSVRIFDVATGREVAALLQNADVTWTSSVAWHPDGRRLAVGCDDGKIHLWDTEANVEALAPLPYRAEGLRLAFNRSGDRLLSTGWGDARSIWDTATGRLLLKLPANSGTQFGADDRLIEPEIHGAQARLWRLADGRELRVLRRRRSDRSDQLTDPVLNADDGILATNVTGHLTFFDLHSGEESAAAPLPADLSFQPFGWDKSGAWLTSGTGGLLAWPAQRDSTRPELLRIGPPRRVSPGLNSPISVGASASPDGRVIAAPDGQFTTVLDQDHPERQFKVGPQFDVRHCAVSADWVVTCSHWPDGQRKGARIWSRQTGQHVHDLPLSGYVTARFSPDNRWLATRSAEEDPAGYTRLWETGTWREVLRFPSASVAFSPDSRLLALTDVVDTIRLVEIASGREVARLSGSEPAEFTLGCFTPDGSQLIARAQNQSICIWDLRAIRARLKEIGLDWDWPEFSPIEPARPTIKPPRVELLLGDLASALPSEEEKARLSIERFSQTLKAAPESADACNNLAWAYLMAPSPLRDVPAAVLLAEKAVRLDSNSAMFANTLGVAYYRAERFREALKVLRPNLARQDDSSLPYDLYFLAMSHYRLGEMERARDYYDWAVRWTKLKQNFPSRTEELTMIRAEAAGLLKIDPK